MDRPEGSPKRPTHPPQFFTYGDTVVLTKRPKKTFFGKETFFFGNIIQKKSPRGCFLPIPLKYIPYYWYFSTWQRSFYFALGAPQGHPLKKCKLLFFQLVRKKVLSTSCKFGFVVRNRLKDIAHYKIFSGGRPTWRPFKSL